MLGLLHAERVCLICTLCPGSSVHQVSTNFSATRQRSKPPNCENQFQCLAAFVPIHYSYFWILSYPHAFRSSVKWPMSYGEAARNSPSKRGTTRKFVEKMLELSIGNFGEDKSIINGTLTRNRQGKVQRGGDTNILATTRLTSDVRSVPRKRENNHTHFRSASFNTFRGSFSSYRPSKDHDYQNKRSQSQPCS